MVINSIEELKNYFDSDDYSSFTFGNDINMYDVFKEASDKKNRYNPSYNYIRYYCLKYGYGTIKNDKEAFKALVVASKYNYPRALLYLGMVYDKGYYNIKRNPKFAYRCFYDAASLNDPYAFYALGLYYENGIAIEQDINTAMELYKKASDKNIIPAKTNLGIIYLEDIAVPSDYELAIKYLTEAGNNEKALAYLGYCYYNGFGVKKSETKALELFNKSIKSNSSKAFLGKYYMDKKDYKKALEYIQPSSEAGNMYGLFYLGMLYEEGLGVECDERKALELYEQVAEMGLPKAQNYTGYCYNMGIGTIIDYDKSFIWYKKAAEHGEVPAQNNLGIAYEDGEGTEVDEKEAFKWYYKAAQAGYSRAQYNLGRCYFLGIGTSRDKIKGVDYLKLAAKNGWEPATELLKEVNML